MSSIGKFRARTGSSFALLLACITLTAGLGACAYGELDDPLESASYELASQIAQNEGEICEAFDYSPASQDPTDSKTSDEPGLGESPRCGAGSESKTYYNSPSQLIDTGESDRDKAREKCGKWAVEHGTLFGRRWKAPKCPGCPSGSSGCKVTDVKAEYGDVRLVGSTYFCRGGSGVISVSYSCTTCVLDGCGDTSEDNTSVREEAQRW